MTNSEMREQNNVHIALTREDEEIHKAIGDIINGRGPNMGGRTVRPHMPISPERLEFLMIQQEAARDTRKMLDKMYDKEADSECITELSTCMSRFAKMRSRTVQLPTV